MNIDFSSLIETNEAITVKKGWGIVFDEKRIGEIYAWHNPAEKREHKLKTETVKILYLDRTKKLSLHFHREKEEIFCCAYGSVFVETIGKNGKKEARTLYPGDRIFIPKCTPHRMTGTGDVNILIEISTVHHDEDSYRIEKGD